MKDFNPSQVAQLKQLGQRLREAREAKQVPLEEIAVKTYIRTQLLKALEEGNLEKLPEPVFVQGFIRRYGDFVGLDGSALAREFVVNPPEFVKPVDSLTPLESIKPLVPPLNPQGSGVGSMGQKPMVPQLGETLPDLNSPEIASSGLTSPDHLASPDLTMISPELVTPAPEVEEAFRADALLDSQPELPITHLEGSEELASAAESNALPAALAEPLSGRSAPVWADAPVVSEMSELVVSEPVVSEPVVSEPVVSEPVVSEPLVSESLVSEPFISQSTWPDPGLPEVARSESGQGELAISQPTISEPAFSEPSLLAPEISEPALSEPALFDAPPAVEALASQSAPALSASEPQSLPQSWSRPEPPERKGWLPWAIAGLSGLAVAMVAIAMSQTPKAPQSSLDPSPVAQPSAATPRPSLSSSVGTQPSPATSDLPTPEAEASSSPESPSTAATPSPSPSPGSPSPGSASPGSGGPVQLGLTVSGDEAWVLVEDSAGKVLFEETLANGAQKSFNFPSGVKVYTGSAGAVQMSCNQSPATVMGEAGQTADRVCQVGGAPN
jgi:cytoskeleton protein RodZ